MNINQSKFNQVVNEAKAKAANSPAWVRAITKAADVILSNPYVDILDNGDVLMVSETSNQVYTVNGKCEGEDGQPCKGYRFNKGVCYHRALKRLIELYNAETAPVAVSAATKLERARERSAANLAHDRVNMRRTAEAARYCGDRDLQHLDRCAPHAPVEKSGTIVPKISTGRASLIADIQRAWPPSWPPLADELMRRFRVNKLEFLSIDFLAAVRAAIA